MKKTTLPLIERIRLLPVEEREALRRRALAPHSTIDTFPFVLFMDKGVYPYVQRRNADYGRESFGRPNKILIALEQIADRQNSASSSGEVSPAESRQKAPAQLPNAAERKAVAELPLVDVVLVGPESSEDSTTQQLPQPTFDPTSDSTEPTDETSHRQSVSMLVPKSFVGIAAVALLTIACTFITVRLLLPSREKNLPVPADERQISNSFFKNSQESYARIDQGTGLRDTGRIAPALAEVAAGRSCFGRNTAATVTGAILPSRLNHDFKEPSTAEGGARVGTMPDKPVIERGQPNPALANSKVPSAQFTQAAEPFTRVLEDLILRAGLKPKPHTLVLGHTILPGVAITGDFSLCKDAFGGSSGRSLFRGVRGDWENITSLFYCAHSLVVFPRNLERLVDGYRQEFGQAESNRTWIDGESGLTFIVHGDCLEISERRTP